VGETARRIGLFFHSALVCAVLAGCNTIATAPDQEDGRGPDVIEKVRSIDLLPRSPSEVQQADLSTGRRAKPIIYAAEPVGATRDGASIQQPPLTGAGRDSIELNFENAAVASVAKVVLGDMLGVGYVIDPRVQGTISLSSGRPIPKSEVLFALENALRVAGIALVRDNAAYRLMPQAEAVGAGNTDAPERTEPGYGLSIVPLQYASAQMLIKLVENFGTKAGMLRSDPSRNLILIQGTGSERRTAIDLLLGFDVDWMQGQSVGIFPVENSNPEPIIAELEKIIDSGEGGVTQHVVRLQPIGRMNAILAVTRQHQQCTFLDPRLLREVW